MPMNKYEIYYILNLKNRADFRDIHEETKRETENISFRRPSFN